MIFMSKMILATILVSMIFLFGCTAQTPVDTTQGDAMEDASNGDSVEDTGAMEDDKGSNGEAMEDSKTSSQKFQRYTKAVFDQAKSDGKVIYLFFTANWCPTCARQHPVNDAAVANPEMPTNVPFFNISFNDSDTNDEDNQIAREFGIVYQHTQIVLDSQGNETYRSTGFVSADEIVKQIKEASG